MNSNVTKDMFYLHTELIDTKVDMAASKAIDRVVEQISALRGEMRNEFHEFREEVNNRFVEVNHRISGLSERVVAIETRLGMVTDVRKEIRGRMIDYCFKGGWLLLASTVSYFVLKLGLT